MNAQQVFSNAILRAFTYFWKLETFQVIARNPLDALYAEFNRIYGGNKTGYADREHLVNTDGSTTWSKSNIQK